MGIAWTVTLFTKTHTHSTEKPHAIVATLRWRLIAETGISPDSGLYTSIRLPIPEQTCIFNLILYLF